MVIAGVIKNGEVRIDVQGLIPDGTEVFVRSVSSTPMESPGHFNIERSKAQIRKVIDLPSSSPDDGFSAKDHDRLLYGEGQ